MKLCIVGQGPSAKGRGREIDACDFVVRMKAFWAYGAEDAGDKISAWAWYGYAGPKGDAVPKEAIASRVPGGTEHWFTHCRYQVISNPNSHPARLDNAIFATEGDSFHQLSDDLWRRAEQNLGYHPSTGFVAICMGLDRFPDAELVLYGFDSTTPDRSNYWDARGGLGPGDEPNLPHRVDLEKRAIAEIRDGTWLGLPTAATLTWPDMPEMK